MAVLFIILPIAIIMAGIAAAVFIASVRSGQFDDLDTPPVRILYDDDVTKSERSRHVAK